MNLQANVSIDLWRAVAGTYEAENFSNAILAATQYMSDLIRERAGVDGDGAPLVGSALGGEVPRLKLNNLETESHRNIQKGFEQILRGFYLGIRNPRSHEQVNDTKEVADSIIIFVNYICVLLNESKETFTLEGFTAKILDPEFVDSPRYAELLVAEVPKLRLNDTIISLFRNRQQVDLIKLRFLIRYLLDALSPAQLSNYLSVVSEELRTTINEASIRTTLRMLRPEQWPQLSEISRLRIETKLIEGIRLGTVDVKGKISQPLATWSKEFLKYFSLKENVADVISKKLYYTEPGERKYIAKYFMTVLPAIEVDSQKYTFVKALIESIREEDENVRTALLANIKSYPQEWQKQLAEGLIDLTDIENPAVMLDDGTPFLSSPANDLDEEIPF